jgi:hypothetical protein
MTNRKIGIRRFVSLAIANPESTFGNSFGGIAQLVERQLCKLEVRGSNPLASSLHSLSYGRAGASLDHLPITSHCSLPRSGL